MEALRIILTIVFIIVCLALIGIVLLQEGKSAGLGAVAAANALGVERLFIAEAEPVMVHTADTSLLMVGDMGKQGGEVYSFLYGTETSEISRFYVNPRKKQHQTTHIALCFRNECLVGVTLLGSIALMQTAQEAVHARWDVETAKNEFMKRGVKFFEE